MKKLILILILIAAVGFGVYHFAFSDDNSDKNVGVRTLSVRKGSLTEVAEATGIIEPHTQVEVKSRASGEVIEILVEEGQMVKQGDILFRLDPIDAERELERSRITLERLRAQLQESKAALSIARYQANEARAEKSVQDEGAALGVSTQTAKRQATHQSQVASATVNQRLASIDSLQAQINAAEIDIALSERRLSETQIIAPFSGTVLSVGVEKGSIVASGITNISGGTALLTLADLSDLRVIGQLDQSQVGKVAVGQKVNVRVDAYPERVFSGRVERVASLGQDTNNVITFDVEIRLIDEDQALLRSGMSADIEIIVSELEDVVLVPLTAIVSDGPKRYIYLEDGSEREVKTGPTDGSRMVVLENLKEGEVIRMIGASPGSRPGMGRGGGRPGMFPMGGGRRR